MTRFPFFSSIRLCELCVLCAAALKSCRPFVLPLTVIATITAHAGEDADFRRAQGFYTLQEYQLAVDAFNKYLADFPAAERGEQARLLLAESRYQLKQYSAAAADFDAFLAKHPQSPRRSDALQRSIKSHYLTKAFDKSLQAADAFLNENRPKLGKPDAHPALPTQFATALYYAGEDHYALKNAEKARANWLELVEKHAASPLIADASEGLGWLHFDAKEFDKALERFKITANTANHPRSAWARLMEGRSLAALKKTDEALAAFKVAPTMTQGAEVAGECALRTAEALIDAGRWPQAIEAYQRLAKDFAAVPSTAPALAAAAYKAGDAQPAEALQLADIYLAAAPKDIDRAAVLRLKARALSIQKKAPEAIEAAKQAIAESAGIADAARKNDEHPAALMVLAELSGKDGIGAYQQVAASYPATRFGLVARYELARFAAESGKLDEALQNVEPLLQALAANADPATAPLRRDALFAACEFSFRKGDFKKAEPFLKQYREAYSDKDARGDDVLRKLAWCRHESADPAGAAALLDAALQAYPKSAFRDEMLYLRALSAGKSNDGAGIVKFNDALVAEFPNSGYADDALYDAAAQLHKQNNLDGAIQKLSALIDAPAHAASPLLPAALQLRATARLQSGRAAEAQADAVALLARKETTDDLKARLSAARLLKALAILAQTGKDAEAEAALNELINAGPPEAPEIPQGVMRRAYLRFNAKRFAEAKDDFIRVVGDVKRALPPELQDAALRLAISHKELKEIPQARAVLEAVNAQPIVGISAFEVPFQLANLLYEANDYAGAIPLYEKALTAADARPDLPPAARGAAMLNRAWSLRRSKAAEKAEAAFAEIVTRDPKSPFAGEALLERGIILSELNKVPDAIETWKKLLAEQAQAPQAEKAMYLMSRAQIGQGDFKGAVAGFEKFVQAYPKSENVRDAYCGLGECRQHLGDVAGARDAFTKALGEKGQDAALDDVVDRALLGLAELNLKQGDALGAKKLVLRILTERPESRWADGAFLFAGQASEGLGEPEKAIGYYRRLLTGHPASVHKQLAADRLKTLGAPVQN